MKTTAKNQIAPAAAPAASKSPVRLVKPGEEKAQRLLADVRATVAAKKKFTVDDMEEIRQRVKSGPMVDQFGRVTPLGQDTLTQIEGLVGDKLSRNASLRWQTTVAEVGGKSERPLQLPENDRPWWQIRASPLHNFQSTKELPQEADVVVIGAGLAGTSAVYHLTGAAQKGLNVVMLERGDPAQEGSGRNGGNIETMPETFLKQYDGIVMEQYKRQKLRYPHVPDEILRKQADYVATQALKYGARNVARLTEIVVKEGLLEKVDFSPSKWVRIPEDEKEAAGIKAEVEFAQKLGLPFELWDPEQVKERYQLPEVNFPSRVAPNSGNYHPWKFVHEVLNLCLERGIKLYTQTGVENFKRLPDGRYEVQTPRGTIVTKKIVFATNGFTSKLIPEMDAIHPFVSQIQHWTHVPDTLHGATVTRRQGDFYWNTPRETLYFDNEGVLRGRAHVGGGRDREMADPDHPRRSLDILKTVQEQAEKWAIPSVKNQPPERAWAGPMGYTDDRLPTHGFLRGDKWGDDGIILIAGCNGYGGTWCIEGGRAAAEMVLTGKTPEGIPEDVFSPNRFLSSEPLFWKGESVDEFTPGTYSYPKGMGDPTDSFAPVNLVGSAPATPLPRAGHGVEVNPNAVEAVPRSGQ
jgi:glycine/D-amino acid oxidase-like deaminating enzyme